MRIIAGLCCVFLLLVAVPYSEGYSGGINNVAAGCTCHGEGVISGDSSVSIEGVPVNWSHGQSYDIYVNLSGPTSYGINQGGFNLRASIGTIASLDETTQVIDGEATHTPEGNDARSWMLQWTAPSSGKIVTFNVLGNAVNGDGIAGNGDHWAKNSVQLKSVEPTGNSEPQASISAKGLLTIAVSIGFALTIIVTVEQIRYAIDDN